MPRFYIPPFAWNPDRLALDSAEAHHAVDVLRMKEGDRATVFNGEGSEAEVEFAKVGRQGVELRRLSVHKAPPLACRVTLGQAIKASARSATVWKAVMTANTHMGYGRTLQGGVPTA